MKTYIYLRKSRKDDQFKTESLEVTLRRHEIQLLAVAKKRNLNVVKILKEVVSGDSIAARPEMIQLLHDCEDGLIDAVLVMDIDRLGRGDMTDQGIIINAFKRNNVQIITPDKSYDLDNEYDEDFFDISAFFARKELKMIKRRLARGKTASLNEGNYIGTNAPFGYQKEKKTLVIIPEQAEIVRLIFDLYVNKGYGDTRIARYLSEHNIPNALGRTDWDRTTIRRMLLNPIYIGKIAWNKRNFVYENGKRKSSTLKPPEEWDIYDGKHEAIIDDITFQRARELSKERYIPHVHTGKALSNPLAYLIKCGACGCTMTQRTSKGKLPSLRCYRHCGQTASSQVFLIEERLIELLSEQLHMLRVKYSEHTGETELKQQALLIGKALAASSRKEQKLQEQQSKQYDLLEQGVYTTDVFLKRSQAVTTSIEEEHQKQSALQEELQVLQLRIDQVGNQLPRILSSIEFLDTLYWEVDAEHKNNFLRSILDHVVYRREKGSKFGDFKLELHLKL